MGLNAKPYLQRVSFKPDTELDFGNYPFSIPAVQELGNLEFHPDVTFFVGENGSGKSTILEAIALVLGYGQEGGTRNNQFLNSDNISPLHKALRVSRSIAKPKDGYFLRAESFYNVATEIERLDAEPSFGPPIINSYGGRYLHAQSHGEAFITLLLKKFRGKGLYLLDEPEAALSPNRQLAALTAIHQLVQDDSQFIIATHSPILLSYPNAKIMLFDGTGITEMAYEDTEHFAVTRDFLNNYPRRLEQLLGDE